MSEEDFPDPLVFTESAALKVKGLIEEALRLMKKSTMAILK